MSKRRHSTSSAESTIQIALDEKPPTPKRRRTSQPAERKKKLTPCKSSNPMSSPWPLTQLDHSLTAATPTKRRLGRPMGSRNSTSRAKQAPVGPALQRIQPNESKSMRGTWWSGTTGEATRILSPDEAVANLSVTANSMTSLFSRGAQGVGRGIVGPPQTPRKANRTTPHKSTHFQHSLKGLSAAFDVDLRGVTSPSKATSSLSKYFSPRKAKGLSTLKFPPLRATEFGLIQEELASNPFHVLVAVMFLSKTTGAAAIPVIRRIAEHYPTAEGLATATAEDIYPDIQHLGFGSTRAQGIIDLAKAWVANPPQKGKRYTRPNYPRKGSGKDIQPRDEPLGDDDPRDAYEVAHLPGIGPYGIDSWRIFCRDDLRGVSSGIEKKTLMRKASAMRKELRQEWALVLPEDKELRAYVKWRWLRLGVNWNQESGEKKDIEPDILEEMQKGRIKEHEGLANPWMTTLDAQVYQGKLLHLMSKKE